MSVQIAKQRCIITRQFQVRQSNLQCVASCDHAGHAWHHAEHNSTHLAQHLLHALSPIATFVADHCIGMTAAYWRIVRPV